jgi:glycosyltransferase involved in cell wall biosynthesis
MRIGINGRFHAARLAGVQRVASEVAREIYPRAETVLFLPADAGEPPHAPPEVVRGKQRGHVFEQVELNTLARAHGCNVLLHPANTAPVQGGPHIVIVHDVLPLTNPEWFTRKYVLWQRHVVLRALRNAAHICTSTAWSADQIARACAVSPTRISLIPQGLAPFVAPASTGDVQSIRAHLDLQAPYFLAVGWGDPRKNLQFLLPVIEKLRTARDVRLVIVGAHNGRVHRAPDFALPPWVHHVARPDDE